MQTTTRSTCKTAGRRCRFGTPRMGRGPCSCEPCVVARRRADKARRIRRARGQTQRMLDASPIREHLATLGAAWISSARIAQLSGVAPQTVSDIQTRAVRDVLPQTAHRLLAVTPLTDKRASRLPTSRVNAIGTRRRIQALRALGWPAKSLAERLGVTPQRLSNLLREDHVQIRTADQVRGLFDDLSMTPGPSPTSRDRCVSKGWAPPLAWDDAIIDDPDATPDAGTEQRSTSTDLLEDARSLLEAGASPQETADRLGISKGYLTALLNGRRGRRNSAGGSETTE